MSPAQQGTIHPPSGRATGATALKKHLPPSLVPYHWRDETCASAQCLVDRTACVGSVYVLSLAGAQIANRELDIAPVELAYLISLFLLGFICPSSSERADEPSHNRWVKLSRNSVFH